MRPVPPIRLLTLPCAAAALAGCATSFEVEHVADPKAPDAFAKPGIYYALPRTEIEFVLQVERRTESGGEFAAFDRCRQDRRLGLLEPDGGCPIAADRKEAEPGWSWTSATLAAVSTVDPEQIYRVEPAAGPFMTVNHTLGFVGDRPGLLASATNSGSNELLGTVVGLVKTLAGVPGEAAGTGEDAEKDESKAQQESFQKRPAPLDHCGLAQPVAPDPTAALRIPPSNPDDVAALLGRRIAGDDAAAAAGALPRLARLSGRQVDCIASILAPHERRIAALRREPAGTPRLLAASADPKGLAAALAEADARRLAEAQAGLQGLRQTMRIDPVVQTQAARLVSTTAPTRAEPCSAPCKVELAVKLVERPAGAGEVSTAGGIAAAFAKKHAVKLKIKRLDAGALGADASPQPAPERAGYRYRFPARARVSAELFDANDQSRLAELASAEFEIAQFGRLVALPARFWGRDASLVFALDGAGALKGEVKLGQKSSGDAGAGDALQALRDARAARAEAAKGAPLERAKFDADLQEQAVRAAKARYCADAWSKVPAQPLPEECK